MASDLEGFLLGKRILLPTKVFIGLCGELTGTIHGEQAHLITSECLISKDRQFVEDQLVKHGGCDIVLLEGTLEVNKDGLLQIIALEKVKQQE